MAQAQAARKQRVRRKRSMSCQNCREVKLKCLDATNDSPCHRCRVRNLRCSGPIPTQRKLEKRKHLNQNLKPQTREMVSINEQNQPVVPRSSQISHLFTHDVPNIARRFPVDVDPRCDRLSSSRRSVPYPHELRVSAVPDPIVDAQSAAQEQQQLRYTNSLYERHVAVSLDQNEYPCEDEQSQHARSSYQNHHLMNTPDSRREVDFTYTSLHPTPLTSYDRTIPYTGPPVNLHSNHLYGYRGGPCQGSESSTVSDYEGGWENY